MGHVLSCGAVVFRWLDDKPHYLLLRAFSFWDFPKGLLDDGELPIQAAQREICEETTLTNLVFHWNQEYRETRPYGQGKIARYYIAEAPTGDVSLPVNPELGHPEHQEFVWADYKTARALTAERVRSILDWAHERIITLKPDSVQ